MEITQGKFATVVLDSSEAMWSRVLKGDRHYSYKKARKIADLMETEPALWQDSGASALERRAAFNRYLDNKGIRLK